MKTSGCPIDKLLNSNPIGRLRAFQKDPFDFFEKNRPGDTSVPVQINMGFRRFFFSYDPHHAQQILQDQKHKYAKSQLVLSKIKALSGPQGLIQLEGEEANRVRQVSGRLMDSDGMNRLVGKVDSFVSELFPLIDKSIAEDQAVDLVPHLTRIVLRTAGVFVLNHDLISESDHLNSAFVNLNRMAGESLRSVASCPFSRSKSKSLSVIHTELDRIADNILDTDEASLLQSLVRNGENPAFVRDQLKAFMFAGYDTTASSLIYSMYLVAAHPETQVQIATESRRVPGRSYESLKKSVLVQSTYKEALRLYPSAYFLPRQTVEDTVLGGVRVPRGSQVFLSVRHIQRHPDYFQDPNSFMADRFLTELKHPFSFIPFGGGPRICIGAALAKLEATLVLQRLCERYEMQAVGREAPAIEALITAHTKSPLLVRFNKRVTALELGEVSA